MRFIRILNNIKLKSKLSLIFITNRPNLYGKNLTEVHAGSNMLSQRECSFEAVMDGKNSNVVIANLIPQNSWNGLRIISV